LGASRREKGGIVKGEEGKGATSTSMDATAGKQLPTAIRVGWDPLFCLCNKGFAYSERAAQGEAGVARTYSEINR